MSEQQGKGRITLKTYFEADKIPREGHFADLIDASLNKIDDQLFVRVEGEGENSARFLGIGSTDPQSPLSIRNRTGDARLLGFEDSGGSEEWHVSINPNGTANGLLLANNNDPDTVVMVEAEGNVGIGTKTPEERLHVDGTIKAAGDVIAQKLQGNLSWDYITGMPNSLIPSGVIVMWSGIAASIPDTWALCDGANGTPDLRDRFIVGAGGSYAPAVTGGQSYVTLTQGQMPSHNHAIHYGGNHYHNFTIYEGNDFHWDNNNHTVGTDDTWGVQNTQTHLGGNHTHGMNAAGGNQAHENRPPYYALCYIMKL